MSESSAPENTPAPENPDLTALNKRLDSALADLESQRSRVKRSSIISMCIGVALLLLLTGYFTYGYVEILAIINKPEGAFDWARQEAERMLPEARKQLEATIKEDAPEWAEMASEELVANAPDIRKRLEGLIFDQTKVLVEQLSGFSEEKFKDFLEGQRPMFESAIRELSSSREPPEKVWTELTEALEDELKVNMQEEADSLLHTVYALNEKLKKLSDGRDLTREESYLRRALMILRRVQLEQANPDMVGKKWTLDSKPDPTLVEEPPEKPDEEPKPEPAQEAEPEKEKTSAPDAKEEAKPKGETPAPKAKEEEAKPKAEPAPEPKEDAKPKAESPAAEPEKAKADKPKAE